MVDKVIFLSTGGGLQSWPVPADFNSSANTVHCVGASGGAGNNGGLPSGGAGAGAWSIKTTVALTRGGPASTVSEMLVRPALPVGIRGSMELALRRQVAERRVGSLARERRVGRAAKLLLELEMQDSM